MYSEAKTVVGSNFFHGVDKKWLCWHVWSSEQSSQLNHHHLTTTLSLLHFVNSSLGAITISSSACFTTRTVFWLSAVCSHTTTATCQGMHMTQCIGLSTHCNRYNRNCTITFLHGHQHLRTAVNPYCAVFSRWVQGHFKPWGQWSRVASGATSRKWVEPISYICIC